MNFEITQVLYNVGAEAVTIVARNPLGGLTNFETTQTALNAKRLAPSGPWGDAECKAIVDEALPEKFPDASLTSSLFEVAP
jgi:hypothetical protein